MDEIDKKIISELQNTDFQRSAILSARLGIGDRTIRRRVSAMRRKNVIKVVAVPQPMALGWRAWAKIGIRVKSGSKSSLVHRLTEHPSIYFVGSYIGKFDIMISVCFDTMKRLTNFVNSELIKIEGVSYVETMILTHPRKYYNFYWPEATFDEDNSQNQYSDTVTSYEVDDIDKQILNILSEDALTPVRLLEERLSIGAATIRSRIKRMLKEGSFKVVVCANPYVLEYEVWATIGLNIVEWSADDVINTLITNPAVYLASACLGRFNIVISAHFKNTDSLNEFVQVELAETKGISAIEIFLHARPLKYLNVKW